MEGEAPRGMRVDAVAPAGGAASVGANAPPPDAWESRWRALMGLSSEWYWEQDREQRFTLVTGPVQDRIGIPADDLVGRSLWQCGVRCNPADREAVEAAIAARRPFYDLQLERDAADGGVRRFAVSGEPVHDAVGQWCGYRGIGKDLTERRRAEVAAAVARRLACATLDALASHACVLDASGRILVTNEAWRRFAAENGAGGKGAFKGASYLAACESARGAARRDGAAVAAAIRAVVAGSSERYAHEYRCDSVAGVRWFVARVSRFPGEGRERVLIEHEDISARKGAEQALRDTARQQGVIAAFGQQALARADASELFELAAAALAQGLGCDPAAIEACGGAGPSLLAPAGVGREILPGEVTGGSAAFVQSIVNILGTALDRRNAEARIARLAHYDELTGLPNRTLLRARVAQATDDARRHLRHAAVMFLDLDDFKRVNDTYGHGVGDEVLVRVAQRLCESVRDGDTVGRLGGDEFAIVLADMACPGDARVVAQRIVDSLARTFVLDGREIGVTASIGIAVHPGAGDDSAALLKNADAAMYRAKGRGRDGCEVYDGA